MSNTPVGSLSVSSKSSTAKSFHTKFDYIQISTTITPKMNDILPPNYNQCVQCQHTYRDSDLWQLVKEARKIRLENPVFLIGDEVFYDADGDVILTDTDEAVRLHRERIQIGADLAEMLLQSTHRCFTAKNTGKQDSSWKVSVADLHALFEIANTVLHALFRAPASMSTDELKTQYVTMLMGEVDKIGGTSGFLLMKNLGHSLQQWVMATDAGEIHVCDDASAHQAFSQKKQREKKLWDVINQAKAGIVGYGAVDSESYGQEEQHQHGNGPRGKQGKAQRGGPNNNRGRHKHGNQGGRPNDFQRGPGGDGYQGNNFQGPSGPKSSNGYQDNNFGPHDGPKHGNGNQGNNFQQQSGPRNANGHQGSNFQGLHGGGKQNQRGGQSGGRGSRNQNNGSNRHGNNNKGGADQGNGGKKPWQQKGGMGVVDDVY